MKILYAGSLSPNDTALYRLWALERLGHQVIPLDSIPYAPSNPQLRALVFRLVMGPHVERLNRDILEIAEREPQRVALIDARPPADATHAKIVQAVRERLLEPVIS